MGEAEGAVDVRVLCFLEDSPMSCGEFGSGRETLTLALDRLGDSLRFQDLVCICLKYKFVFGCFCV